MDLNSSIDIDRNEIFNDLNSSNANAIENYISERNIECEFNFNFQNTQLVIREPIIKKSTDDDDDDEIKNKRKLKQLDSKENNTESNRSDCTFSDNSQESSRESHHINYKHNGISETQKINSNKANDLKNNNYHLSPRFPFDSLTKSADHIQNNKLANYNYSDSSLSSEVRISNLLKLLNMFHLILKKF
jgi:hypothetical protein